MLLLFAVWWGVGVQAQPASHDLSPQQAREARQQGDIKPLRWVLRQIKPHYAGRVLGVKLSRTGRHGYVYRVKMLQDNGHLVRLHLDANTAEILHHYNKGKARKE